MDLARHSAALAEAEHWSRLKVEEVLMLALPSCGLWRLDAVNSRSCQQSAYCKCCLKQSCSRQCFNFWLCTMTMRPHSSPVW